MRTTTTSMSHIKQYIRFDEGSDYVTANFLPFTVYVAAKRVLSFEPGQPTWRPANAEELLRAKLALVTQIANSFLDMQKELARKVYETYGDQHDFAEYDKRFPRR